LLNGVIGPVVEELYFRGFLLPRMEGLGRWAPLVNVTLSRSVFFGPVADRGANSRDRADDIRGSLEAKRLSRNGGALRLNTLGVTVTTSSVLSRIS
jgi:hypothetical protein